jgi:hypothetical protein
MSQDELYKAHEKQLAEFVDRIGGTTESDWALVRALVHKAVHLTADRKAGEFCALATLLAEMIQHAHEVMHPSKQSAGHQAMTH